MSLKVKVKSETEFDKFDIYSDDFEGNEMGIKTITDNVIVSLSESFKNSFPRPGSRVIIRILNKIPVVVREYIDDIDQFYAKRKIATDNSPNGDASVSYMILPGGGLD